jgi:adenylate kinase
VAQGARVVLLGPPGAGKGTQAKLLQEKLKACQISTGDILRKAVADETALGKEAAQYIERGALVPDELIVNMVAERLKENDCQPGFILDGFPRTIGQAESLDRMLQQKNLSLNGVLSVQVPREVIIQRLAGRRSCKKCGALWHMTFSPPRKPGICDRCGGELYQRQDDEEQTVAHRLQVYEQQTAPLVQYYRNRKLLREIDGVGLVEQVRARVFAALEDVVA